MPSISRLRFLTGAMSAALALLVAPFASAQAGAAEPREDADYEIWALDQGTHTLHIFNRDLEEIDMLALSAEGVRVPHMIDFTSDHAYAFIASTGSGDVTVVRTEDREIVARLETGPRTHMAAVTPDDRAVIAAVIGSADEYRDGKLVEILIGDNGEFTIERELVIALGPLFTESEDRFNDVAPICHQYTADSRHAYVTLGPGLADGGLVILDTKSFELVNVFPPEVLPVNCGTALTADGRHMLVNGGDGETGMWYALDVETQEVVHAASSLGLDAHGLWPTPDGREIWMVNRVTDNVVIIDPETFKIIENIEEGLGDAPDIIAISPDSERVFITLRGPNPVSAPHLAVGTTPGIAVVDVAAREQIALLAPNADEEASDFHGIGIRVIHDSGE